MTTLVVIAKECVPGRVKTRLNPPLSLEQAARVAAASLSDTLRAVASLPATRRILAFEGNLLPDGSEDYEVIPQSSGGLDMRLAAIFDLSSGPTVLIGMDTPQLTAEVLDPLFSDWPSDVDAWFGPANDGGFWVLGLAEPDGSLIRGVPMSQDDTGALQLRRLTDAGLRVRMLPELVDVDTIADAREVARQAPDGEFARTLRSVDAATEVSS
ncbi:TIGR04282 family arsenosugar biosynthesis glycosyltransferase [Leifsonia aquatica]|uniref:TIGR04282 family arsenosugar biosynthesis glycosyltransferase n=1 Tax=Leifsonia aquatica TaxID=144185 RepID=UPI0038181711